jgi:isopentenyl-diphosphate delta-isomerase
VLVDQAGRQVGTSDKLSAHLAPGHLHRAFSVFLFNSEGALLLQRRAATKYHFAGLWSNSCCGHPGPSDDLVVAAIKRTREELGVSCELLTAVGSIVYRAVDETTGLVEHEFDHLLAGLCHADLKPDEQEVMETAYVPLPVLTEAVARNPGDYTPWLPIALPIVRRSCEALAAQ